jgi:hypothetical protein
MKKSKNKKEETNTVVNIHIKKGIGISIISNSCHPGIKSTELIYIYMHHVGLKFELKNDLSTIDLKIQYLNIDNNLDIISRIPVMLTPRNYKASMEKGEPFFILKIEKR